MTFAPLRNAACRLVFAAAAMTLALGGGLPTHAAPSPTPVSTPAVSSTPVARTPAATSEFPALSGRVVDDARLLEDQTRTLIDRKLATLEADTGVQFVVVTTPDLKGREIEEYGYRLGRAWGIGNKEADNGVLLIVAPTERKVRIEVGYGLEGVLTDAYSAQVIQNEILPAFRTGGFQRGINNGVDAVIAQLRADPEVAAERAQAAVAAAPAPGFPVSAVVIIGLVLLFLFLGGLSAAASGGRRRRRGGGLSPVLIWAASEALRNQGRGGGGGFGGFGGGGFGGGGFGGGGGSFGGGGASGGW